MVNTEQFFNFKNPFTLSRSFSRVFFRSGTTEEKLVF